jgi:hypothetical protein
MLFTWFFHEEDPMKYLMVVTSFSQRAATQAATAAQNGSTWLIQI